jgi:hypothetical protein
MMNKSFCNRTLSRPANKYLRRSTLVYLMLAALAGTLLSGSSAAKDASAPNWMHVLSSLPLPPHDEKTDAVILYSEIILVVEPNGKIKETERTAYKILRPSGRYVAKQYFIFDDQSRITDIHGWCIPAQGSDYEVKQNEIIERGMGYGGGILYSDIRAKTMELPAAEPGNIVGYEVTKDSRPYLMQYSWDFQSTLPVASSKYTLQLPPGWEYKAAWSNHAELNPTSVGANQWQWQVSNIPEIKHEQEMPPWRGVAGVMIISLIPPGGTSRGFWKWSDMSSWYTGLIQGRRDASPEIKQEVATLTANMSDPVLKMRALAQFMQKDIRYVGIELGIGGVQPHAARDVFSNRFGDCKDKATLLSSMLKEIGIDSYLIPIYATRGAVTPTVPPYIGDFNHVILGIHLQDSVKDASLLATMEYPGIGRLLIFDPTDEVTPFGSLRGALQGNYALLVVPDGGGLIQTPQLPVLSSGVNSTAKMKLAVDGSLSGDVTQVLYGDSATRQRYFMRDVNKDADRIKPIETELSRSLGNFQITKATVGNLAINDRPLQYKYSFTAQDFAKTAGNLLLVRPRVIGNLSSDLLEKKEPRVYPVEFPGPERIVNNYEIELPSGYEVDDLPAPTDIEYSFASYHSKTEVKGNTLLYTRTYEIKELSVPVEKLDQLKTMYRAIAGDERNTAVLKAKAN